MRSKRSKLLSFLVVLVMIFTVQIPGAAFAEDDAGPLTGGEGTGSELDQYTEDPDADGFELMFMPFALDDEIYVNPEVEEDETHFRTIQAAVNAAADGDTIHVAEGMYSENLTINKDITLSGPNSGLAGSDSARSEEAVLYNSNISVVGATVTIDGFHVLREDNISNGIILQASADTTITNSIIERNGDENQYARGIVTAANTTATISNNLFTGDDSGGFFSGNKAWRSAIYSNGGTSADVVIMNNVFENCRTAINFDDFSSGIRVSGNTFQNNGTHLSFGGTSPTTGHFTLGSNEFGPTGDAIVNLSNVASSFRLDITSSTFGGRFASALNPEEQFALEAGMYHRGRAGRNGLVTYADDTQFVIPLNPSINAAIEAADAGDSIIVATGTYEVGKLGINKNLSITGADKNTTVIKPSQDITGGNHTDSAAWFVISSGVAFDLSNVTLDGTGKNISIAIMSHGSGVIENNIIKNIYGGHKYAGIAIELYGSDMSVSSNSFSNIQRIGVFTGYNTAATAATIENNTYQGKGSGDFLDYAFEVGRGGHAAITGNAISGNRGVASTDSSSSAGILVTSYYHPETPAHADITGNTISDCTTAVFVGYNNSDNSVVTVSRNNLAGNTFGIKSTNPSVEGQKNWWGTVEETEIQGFQSGSVSYDPWYNSSAMDTLTSNHPVINETEGASYDTIQAAIDTATSGDTISVMAGTYRENVVINKDGLTIKGAGAANTKIVGTAANSSPLTFSSNNATAEGFTLTHEYTTAELDNWNAINNNGVSYRQTVSGNTLQNCTVTLNRNGIYLNTTQNNQILNNTITNNRTGINMTNNVNGTEIRGNTISDNWTVGLVTYAANSTSTNLSNVTVRDNTFTSNWYSEVLVKDTATTSGAFTGTLDVSNNTFTDSPVTYTTSSHSSLNEPGWLEQKPAVAGIGGLATRPAVELPTLRIYNSGTVSLKYDEPKTLNVGGNEYQTIQAAVNDASAGDTIRIAEGTYNGQLTVNKNVAIIGAGKDKTIISGNPAVLLAASGTADQPVKFKDLQVVGNTGFRLTPAAIAINYVTLENVSIKAAAPGSGTGIITGVKGALRYFTISGSEIDGFRIGIDFSREAANHNKNEHVTVTDTILKNNSIKGFYAESLSDAVFTNAQFLNNGVGAPQDELANQHAAGIDINLKYGYYQNLTFNNLTVSGCGINAKEGAGMMIKARDDGSYSANPATLNLAVINGGAFTGNERGIRVGEPGQNNAGPDSVVINNAVISGNNKTYSGTDGSTYGGIVNMSQTTIDGRNNYWGAAGLSMSGDIFSFPWYVDAGKTRLANQGYNLTSPSKSRTSANLSWTGITGADGYNVYNGGSKVNSTVITGTTYTVSGLSASTTYSFSLKVVAGGIEYDISDAAISVTTNSPSSDSSGPNNPPPTPPPAPPALDIKTQDDKVLSETLKSTGQASLDLTKSESASAGLSTNVITQLATEKAPLIIKNTGVQVNFAPNSLITPELTTALNQADAIVEIGAKQVSEEEKQSILASAPLGESTGIFEVGGVIVDLSANVTSGGDTSTKIENFSDPVAVTIDLSGLTLTPEQIGELSGIRFEKDEAGNIVPVPLGGSYDPVTKTFTFYTTRFSLYSVLQVKDLVKLELTIGNHVSKVNGSDRKIDVAPSIVKGRTMVPLRFIGEAMDAEFVWDGKTRSVTIKLDGKELKLFIDKLEPGMDVPATIVNNRTFVPIRYLTEAFGAEVTWFPAERKVLIVN